ncbi:uncharacterized protein LOC141856497 isoform X1 [Brevipalpus obovatus]|uniref:uncharacterized protein LOC141856497 isoform X1 n=1 Tax=Brevipalpus obovatus TaxID=246614 RepID=UPI003D9E0D7C
MNSYLTTSTHLWIYVGTVLFFVLMMEKFDEKFTMKQRSLLLGIAQGLIVLCCFSLAIFNVRSVAPTSQSSAIFIGLLYSGLMFYLFCDICWYAQGGREMIIEKMVKRKTETNHCENHTQSSLDINSNDGKKVQSRRANFLLIFLRLSKIAYFPSTIVIFTFYATMKEPVDLISFNQVKNIFAIYSCILGVAPIFYILVIGPYLRLMHYLRTGRKSMAKKMRID